MSLMSNNKFGFINWNTQTLVITHIIFLT